MPVAQAIERLQGNAGRFTFRIPAGNRMMGPGSRWSAAMGGQWPEGGTPNTALCGITTRRPAVAGSASTMRAAIDSSKTLTAPAPSSTRRTMGAASSSKRSWFTSVPVTVTSSGTPARRASRSAVGPVR